LITSPAAAVAARAVGSEKPSCHAISIVAAVAAERERRDSEDFIQIWRNIIYLLNAQTSGRC